MPTPCEHCGHFPTTERQAFDAILERWLDFQSATHAGALRVVVRGGHAAGHPLERELIAFADKFESAALYDKAIDYFGRVRVIPE